jgi:DNA-binding PadR family transcriptional regulator
MTKVKINSVVKLYTLCLLNNGPKHGYEIIKELETRMNRSISASHVYPFLKDLEDNKVISCKEVEQREKKRYKLTKNGEHFLEIVFSNLEGLIDSAIQRRLTTCAHCKCKLYSSGHKESIDNKEQVFCCSHCAKAFKEQLLTI